MTGERTHGSEREHEAGENVKFLIIRFSSIGDIVLTTPVIRCLKEQVKGAQIHFLTKSRFVPLITANPYIDRIHELRDQGKIIRALRQENFDYIIDLHNNLRTAIIKSRLPLVAFSFNKLNLEKWLLVNFRIDHLPDIHIVDRYLETVRLFDVVNDHRGLDYFIPPMEEVALADLPAAFHNGYILFAIGANHATKRLPAEKITEICRITRLPVILAGGMEDASIAEIISNACGPLVWNACGKFSINQSASLVRQARVVITHDTGLMHIAAAFRKKIISVWGNTIPGFGMSPYMAGTGSAIHEVRGLKCRPCSKLGFEKCPKKHFKCMMDQDTSGIATLACRLFGTA
jgi:ADP-heptose:LPS heptosyltransferase